MKKLFIFVCIMGLSLNIAHSEQPATLNAKSYSEQELSLLKEQYRMLMEQNTKAVAELKAERKEHQDFVATIYKYSAGLIGLVVVILSIFGYRTIKEAKESMKETVKESLQKEWNTVFKKLAIELDTNPKALKEAIKDKVVENELKNNYSIRVLYETEEVSSASDLENLLYDFGFASVDKINRNKISDSVFSKNDIIILLSNLKEGDVALQTKLENSDNAILVYGDARIGDIQNRIKNNKCIGGCTSLSNLYQNLLSLLHYKRYLNKM